MALRQSAHIARRRVQRGVVLFAAVGCGISEPKRREPTFERVFELSPEEGVFAYSRISPDGRYLAYASEAKDSPPVPDRSQLINVVDLTTRQVLFTEPGIDAYWSTDGTRMIYESFKETQNSVVIRDMTTGAITRDVAPTTLGDYYSWGIRDGRQVILTILGRYFYLTGNQAELPAGSVPSCPRIGVGQRPLLSKDGKRITTFVGGVLVIRNLTDCNDVLDTRVPGAKADFSFDGRYVAFHELKPDQSGYQIAVIDVEKRTIRTVTNLPGNSYFPSWTADGRLSFRYDGSDYRGFMMASDVLSAPEGALPEDAAAPAKALTWADVFPGTPQPRESTVVVMVWGAWSAHAPRALTDIEAFRAATATQRGSSVRVLMATDPGSDSVDVRRLVSRYPTTVPRIPLSPAGFLGAAAHNQNPTTLLFKAGYLVNRRLGAQDVQSLRHLITQ